MICPECGQAFDGDKCPVCGARKKAIENTLIRPFRVALLGSIGGTFAFLKYHPLGSPWLVVSVVAVLFAAPLVTGIALDKFHRLTRYPALIGAMMVFAAASVLVLASYFYLNGALDGSPPVMVEATVTDKSIKSRNHGNIYFLTATVSWNGETFEDDDLFVGRATFSDSELGDSVRVIVHPGEFSLPWYSYVLPSENRRSDSR
jgi:hypothetical protein